MWVLTGIFIHLAIGYIFIELMEMYEHVFWEQVALMLLWPMLVIIFCICCIYFGWKELYKKVKNYERKKII